MKEKIVGETNELVAALIAAIAAAELEKEQRRMKDMQWAKKNKRQYSSGLSSKRKEGLIMSNTSKAIQRILDNFDHRMKEIKSDVNDINIVNAGVTNYGKSSLFNSLLGKNKFAVEDVRTTITADKGEYMPGVNLIDTPGLEARTSDDETASTQYKNADLILFVHAANTGELHKNEMDWLGKIRSLFADDSVFWKRLCIVLTKAEDNDPVEIKNKICEDIKTTYQADNIRIFVVSNEKYLQGIQKGKSGLVARSGINELKKYIDENVETWRAEKEEIKAKRIEKLAEETIVKLVELKEQVKGRIYEKKQQNHNRINQVKNSFSPIYDELRSRESSISSLSNQLSSKESEISNLEWSHNNDKSRY